MLQEHGHPEVRDAASRLLASRLAPFLTNNLIGHFTSIITTFLQSEEGTDAAFTSFVGQATSIVRSVLLRPLLDLAPTMMEDFLFSITTYLGRDASQAAPAIVRELCQISQSLLGADVLLSSKCRIDLANLFVQSSVSHASLAILCCNLTHRSQQDSNTAYDFLLALTALLDGLRLPHVRLFTRYHTHLQSHLSSVVLDGKTKHLVIVAMAHLLAANPDFSTRIVPHLGLAMEPTEDRSANLDILTLVVASSETSDYISEEDSRAELMEVSCTSSIFPILYSLLS